MPAHVYTSTPTGSGRISRRSVLTSDDIAAIQAILDAGWRSYVVGLGEYDYDPTSRPLREGRDD